MVPLVAVALGTACSGLGDNFREPEIRLDHAVIRGVGFSGGILDLVVGSPGTELEFAL